MPKQARCFECVQDTSFDEVEQRSARQIRRMPGRPGRACPESGRQFVQTCMNACDKCLCGVARKSGDLVLTVERCEFSRRSAGDVALRRIWKLLDERSCLMPLLTQLTKALTTTCPPAAKTCPVRHADGGVENDEKVWRLAGSLTAPEITERRQSRLNSIKSPQNQKTVAIIHGRLFSIRTCAACVYKCERHLKRVHKDTLSRLDDRRQGPTAFEESADRAPLPLGHDRPRCRPKARTLWCICVDHTQNAGKTVRFLQINFGNILVPLSCDIGRLTVLCIEDLLSVTIMRKSGGPREYWGASPAKS